MENRTSYKGTIYKNALKLLKCPACKSSFKGKPDKLECEGCGRTYNIVNNIPIILFDVNEFTQNQTKYFDTSIQVDYTNPLIYKEGLSRITAVYSLNKIDEWNLKLTETYLTNARVLEIGCGLGQLTRKLALKCSEVYAFDISYKSIIEAIERNVSLNTFYFVSSTRKIPFENETFDVVVSSEVIEHVYDYHGMLNEMRRVLKVGGKMCISTPNAYIFMYPKNLVKIFRNPLKWSKRLKRETSWDENFYDCWIMPHTLKRWMREHELDILEHKTFIYFYRGGFLYSLLEKVENAGFNASKLLNFYIKITDKITEGRIPFISKLGIRQAILVEKR